ncbi:MAG: ubiquinone/menaquinone biosynthesis C-methylase UbiE [Planctomycetota bacterium]|jgi:ubiquinone/menaquinone biosynthesis C-methylase UbiE
MPSPARCASLALLLLTCFGCNATDSAGPPEETVKPGINDSFLNPDLDVESFVERFEGESREVYAKRAEIVQAMGIEPGQTVADIGAGTGAFIGLLAEAVGSEGHVLATDIAPAFVERLSTRAAAGGYTWVKASLGGERDVILPNASVDKAFICAVYHHFEYPRTIMATLHKALKPGGEVIIVDFERIPGVTKQRTLDHVRAGKLEVTEELESYGFTYVEEFKIRGMNETWARRYRR